MLNRKRRLRTLIRGPCILIVSLSILSLFSPKVFASTTPFTPHDISILFVYQSNDATYLAYGDFLAEFGRYGFNITILPVPASPDTDFTTHKLSANINQYDVVVLTVGNANDPLSKVTVDEVDLFCKKFGGLLIMTDQCLMYNQSDTFWSWTGSPMTTIEARFGVDFTGWSNTLSNVTLYRKSSLIPELPDTLTYMKPSGTHLPLMKGTVTSATLLYNFTSSYSIGISYYSNATGSKAMFINNRWVFASEPKQYYYEYWGIGNDGVTTQGYRDLGFSMRAEFMARIIAYSFGMDFNTIIKPQPLANLRIDDVGPYPIPNPTINDTYILACLQYLQSCLDEINVPKVDICPLYWARADYSHWDDNPNSYAYALTKKDVWEWSNHNDHLPYPTEAYYNYTTEQHNAVMTQIINNATTLGFDKPIPFMAGRGDWSPNAWESMHDFGYWFSSILTSWYDEITGDSTRDDAPYYLQPVINTTWGIFIHGATMSGITSRNTPKFSQWSKAEMWRYYQSAYANRIDDTICAIDTFVQPLDHWENWGYNEVGPYVFKTYYSNLTNDFPDIKWVYCSEATNVIAGNKYATLSSVSQTGDTISFTLNVDKVPTLTMIEKGMLWYRINAGQKIQGVTIDGSAWYDFDDYSIRIPAVNSDVVVTLGASTSTMPHITEHNSPITSSSWDGSRLYVTVSATPGTKSTIKFDLGNLGEPLQVIGSTSYSIDGNTLVCHVHHSPATIEIIWSEVPEIPINTVPEVPTNTTPEIPTNTVPEIPTNTVPEIPTEAVPENSTNAVPEIPTDAFFQNLRTVMMLSLHPLTIVVAIIICIVLIVVGIMISILP